MKWSYLGYLCIFHFVKSKFQYDICFPEYFFPASIVKYSTNKNSSRIHTSRLPTIMLRWPPDVSTGGGRVLK